MVCSDCKYPYVPSSGKCPSCGHQNTDWGTGLVILFLLFVFFILFLPVFLVGIGLYNGGKKLKYIFGWILVAYFAYSVVDGFNRWFMYEGLIWILKDYIAIGYILNFVGLIFGIAWISKGYKPDTPQHEESVIKDEEDEYEETENTIEEVNTSKSPNFEDIKKAKELLDLGAISQEEFEQIKHKALSTKPIVAAKPQPEELRRQEVTPMPKPIQKEPHTPAEKHPAYAEVNKSNKKLKWLIGGVVFFIIAVASFFVFESSKTSRAGENLTTETDVHFFATDGKLGNNPTPDFMKSFSGSINNKYKIEVTLKNVSGSLSGRYHYVGKQAILELTGTVDGSGNISLREYDNKGSNTGIFSGQLINGTIQGQWSTPDKQKTYSFTVNEMREAQSVYQLLQGKWQSEDDPKSYKIFEKYVLIDGYEGQGEGEKEEYLLSDECQNDSDKGSPEDKDKYISLLKSDMCFHIDHIDSKSLSLVYMARGNFLSYRKVTEGITSSSSVKDGFLSTPSGERYKVIKVQVPNHDEENTISEIDVTGPVEGIYISRNEGKSRSIQINYDGHKIYVLHWDDSKNAKREDAYVTSKGYLSFGSEEFEYDRYGETVTEVKNLSLVERFTGQVFVWNTEWQGD